MKHLLKAILILTALTAAQANAESKSYRDNVARIANERDAMKARALTDLTNTRHIQDWTGYNVSQKKAMDNTELQVQAISVILESNIYRMIKYSRKSFWAWTYSGYATAKEESKASRAAEARYRTLYKSAQARLEIDQANSTKGHTAQGDKGRALGKLNWAKAFLADVVELGKATDIQFNKYPYHKSELASTLALAADSVAKAEKLYAKVSEYANKLSDSRYVQDWNGRTVSRKEAMSNTNAQISAIRVIMRSNLNRKIFYSDNTYYYWGSRGYDSTRAAYIQYSRLLDTLLDNLEIDEVNSKKSHTLQEEKDRALSKLDRAKSFLADVVALGKNTDIRFSEYIFHREELARTLALAADSVAKATTIYIKASEYVDKYSEGKVLGRYDSAIAAADDYFEAQKAIYDIARDKALEQEASELMFVSFIFYEEQERSKELK
jgi:hypothetical protein